MDMLNDFNYYGILSDEQIENAIEIMQSGKADQFVRSCTQEQKDAIYNYTNCGGFEINSFLNDASLTDEWRGEVRTRDEYGSIEKIQNIISGIKGNRNFDTTQGDIIRELDTVISSANYDEAVVTYRGVKKLYDGNVEIDTQNLKIGDSFRTAGYQSSSVVMERCYGMKNGTDTILRVIVPPNSKSAAYIENISGVNGYGQMEMLIKRNATMTVVGDLEYTNVNGEIKTIIPVMVQ